MNPVIPPIVRTLRLAAPLAAALALVASTAASAALRADYHFDDSLASSVAGAPNLMQVGLCSTFGAYTTDSVRGLPDRLLTFDQGCGL